MKVPIECLDADGQILVKGKAEIIAIDGDTYRISAEDLPVRASGDITEIVAYLPVSTKPVGGPTLIKRGQRANILDYQICRKIGIVQ